MCVFLLPLFSQKDSLLNELEKPQHDTSRVNLLIKVAETTRKSSPDSSLLFLDRALQLANKMGSKSKVAYVYFHKGRHFNNEHYYDSAYKYFSISRRINEKLGKKRELAKCEKNIGSVLSDKGEHDSATYYLDKAETLFKELNDSLELAGIYTNLGNINFIKGNSGLALDFHNQSLNIHQALKHEHGIAACYTNMGIVYRYQGNYQLALKYYQKAVRYFEKMNDRERLPSLYNNLGIVHWKLESYNQAISYFNKSMKIYEENGNRKGISMCYNNLGLVYDDKGEDKYALVYYKKALQIFKEFNYKRGMSACYTNIGTVYNKSEGYDSARYFFNKALKIDKERGDKVGISLLYNDLASLNLNLYRKAKPGNRQQMLQKALNFALKALKIGEEIESLPQIKDASDNLSQIYEALANYRESLRYANLYIETNDSLFSKEKTEAIQEMEAKYQLEKKEQQIKIQETELAKQKENIARQEAENAKRVAQRNIFIVAFVLVLVLAGVILNSNRQKKKANRILKQQKDEIRTKNIELNQRNEEILAQRDEIEAQKLSTEKIHQKVADSIQYAEHIQKAVLPAKEFLDELLPEHFVFFRPLSVVSGDFYWAAKTESHTVFAIADCTGHGVPGAFMSMLGISFLNEIVRKPGIMKANQVLNILRNYIIRALHQRGVLGEQKDGLDIGFCLFDQENYTLQFAGANRPLYIVKEQFHQFEEDNEKSNKNIELIEVKGDKMPIAIYEDMHEFTNHEIQLGRGDNIYLLSDGYTDQFGGPRGHKFKNPRFREMLLQIATLPMKDQYKVVQETFDTWKYTTEQIDDVVVMGVRV